MLSDIRTELMSDFGVSQTNTNEVAYFNRLINAAINELYTNNELYLSEREQIMDVGQANQVITLPSEVNKVLAVRRYETRIRVKQEDMRMRYRSMGWAEPYLGYPYLAWRFKNRSCLKKEFLNTAPFTYTINQPVTGGFTITITGATNTASKVIEVITFSSTDTTKTGTVPFVSYDSIQKNVTTTQDISVTDADGNEVANIPNHKLKCSYPYYQILDRYESFSTETTLVEVLYKLSVDKLVNDTDRFLEDVYDRAVYYKAAAMYLIKKPGEDSVERAAINNKACEDTLKGINESYMHNASSEIVFAPAVGSKIISSIRAGVFEFNRA